MEMRTLARPYAKAAFDYALAQDALASWASFLQAAAMVSADPEVQALLPNPNYSEEQILALYDAVCANSSKQQQQFLQLLSEYRRLDTLPAIAAMYADLYQLHEQTVSAQVTTFAALSEGQQVKLQQVLSKRFDKNVSVNYVIDDSLLGGMIVRVGDTVIDGSVRSKLHQLARALDI